MIDQKIEGLLIKSVHSDKLADQYFAENVNNPEVFYSVLQIVEESESGDAQMQGAYWISQFNDTLLSKEEPRLLSLMDCEWDSVSTHIMIALSRIKSKHALQKIIEDRIRPHLYWEAVALKNYFPFHGE